MHVTHISQIKHYQLIFEAVLIKISTKLFVKHPFIIEFRKYSSQTTFSSVLEIICLTFFSTEVATSIIYEQKINISLQVILTWLLTNKVSFFFCEVNSEKNQLYTFFSLYEIFNISKVLSHFLTD